MGLSLIAAVLTWAPAVDADAARILTWTGPGVAESRFVDPSAAPAASYNEPPGVDERPNALAADVYLPTGYRAHPQRRYPVLFLLHGQGDAYDSWPNPADGDLRRTAKGFGGVIVMPEADRGFYANWWNSGQRGAPGWERYHLDQLVPLVERRLRIRHARRWHAIAGLSMGGEGAIFYASQRPGYFGSAASFSGPLSIQRQTYQQAFNAATGQRKESIFGDPQAQDFYWDGHDPSRLVENLRHTRLYVAAGNGVPNPTSPDELTNYFGQAAELELGQQAGEFVDAAEAAGDEVTYAPHQGIHDWQYWRADLEHAIDWGFFRRPRPPHRRWSFETVARRGVAWRLAFRFAEPPAELIRFERTGETLVGTGSGTVKLRRGRSCPLVLQLPFRITLASPHDRRSGGGCATR